MRRNRLRTAVSTAGLLVCAMAALGSSSWALAQDRYVLRRPHHEHCKAHYIKRVVTLEKRVHGHAKKLSETVCLRPHYEHCKAHYIRKVVIVKKRVHGHVRKVRKTVCVHVRPKPAPSAVGPETTAPVLIPTPPLGGGSVRGHGPHEPEPREPKVRQPKEREPEWTPTCTSIFTGTESNVWALAANWTDGVPGGFSSYGCIPAEYPNTVTFSTNPAVPTEVGGVSAENPEGITLEGGDLALTNPGQMSLINNIKPGAATITLEEGVVLALTGQTGELGGDTWNGPGTIEIPHGTLMRTGVCARWGKNGTHCVDGTPTPGHDGLQVKNHGEIVGAGISLCQNGAAQPAKLENEGAIQIFLSGAFGAAPECGGVGSVVNGQHGAIGIARLDGNGCNVQVGIASLQNKGRVKLGSCYTLETGEEKRPELEIGSSLSEAGEIIDGGIVHIQGDYTPTDSSNLTIGVKENLPPSIPDTNYGTMKISGSATLAGELNVEEYPRFAPTLGETFQILDVGEASGSLSGEFTPGNLCIPAEPGYGYKVGYKFGDKGTVTLEVAEVAGC